MRLTRRAALAAPALLLAGHPSAHALPNRAARMIVPCAPEEARAFTVAEMQKWGDAARKAGITPQ
jgi:hypothetical protein